MPAQPESYVIPAAGVLSGGRYRLPAWRRAMVPETWAEISTNTLSDIDPEDSPVYNPSYPAEAPWHGTDGQPAVIDGWCTATFDDVEAKLYIPLGGGHGSYAGNEGYLINLMQDSPSWQMLYPPSTESLDTGQIQEATGLYPDGRLRSCHTYNNLIFVPGVGNICARMAGAYSSGQTSNNNIWKIHDTGEATLLVDNSAVSQMAYAIGGGVAYDASRHALWGSGVGNGRIFKVDCSTWELTQPGDYVSLGGDYVKPVFLNELDIFACLNGGLILYNPSTGGQSFATLSGEAFPSSFSFTGKVGAIWHGGKIWIWNNTGNTGDIYTLTPGGDPYNDSWIRGVVSPSAKNTVTPTSMSCNGTYGRFGYSSRLNGFYLINSTTSSLYFYAPEV